MKIPTDFDVDKTRKKFGSSITPTSVVLLQELERFNDLLSRMRKSLFTLRKVFVFASDIENYASLCPRTSHCATTSKHFLAWLAGLFV